MGLFGIGKKKKADDKSCGSAKGDMKSCGSMGDKSCGSAKAPAPAKPAAPAKKAK